MKKASITYTKNNLSRLVNAVREGATVWITDRDVPVARLVPVGEGDMPAAGRIGELVRAGLASPPKRALEARRFAARAMPKLKAGTSAVQAVTAEREEAP